MSLAKKKSRVFFLCILSVYSFRVVILSEYTLRVFCLRDQPGSAVLHVTQSLTRSYVSYVNYAGYSGKKKRHDAIN